MKIAILACALLPLSLSADVLFETTKHVDREMIVMLSKKSDVKSKIIESAIENEKNRFALHFVTYTGEQVESTEARNDLIEHRTTHNTGVIKPQVVISDLVYNVKPCVSEAAMAINAVCVKYKANVELTMHSEPFMDMGELVSFNSQISTASRILLKRDGKE